MDISDIVMEHWYWLHGDKHSYKANFVERDLVCYEFENDDLRYAIFGGDEFYSTSFENCNLQFAEFGSGSQIRFKDCDMKNADFSYSKIKDARFINCDLSNANFEGTDLRAVYFDNCNLTNANFKDAILASGKRCFFGQWVDMETTFDNCILTNTILEHYEQSI